MGSFACFWFFDSGQMEWTLCMCSSFSGEQMGWAPACVRALMMDKWDGLWHVSRLLTVNAYHLPNNLFHILSLFEAQDSCTVVVVFFFSLICHTVVKSQCEGGSFEP